MSARDIKRGRAGGLRGPAATAEPELLEARDEAVAAAVSAAGSVTATDALLDTVSDERSVVLSAREITGGYAAGSFKRWSVGFESGTGKDAADGAAVFDLTVAMSFGSGVTAANAWIVQRDRDDPDFATAPPGGADSDVTIRTFVDLTLADIGITAGGAAGSVQWVLAQPLVLDPLKSYSLVMTADDGVGSLAPQITAPATDYNNWRRGWFTIGGGTADLDPGQAVALTIRTTKRDIRPSLRRERKVAARIFCGDKTAYPFDNSTAKTFRAIMALARGFTKVRLLFNNGGSAYNVAKCAVAVIAAPSNYACAGVTWVPVTFDNGLTSAAVPASPGATRRGWLGSDWIDIASIARSDDPDACPFIVGSAYVDTADDITILGHTDGSQDYTGYAAHADRPVAFRYNDGDCVTTPASFASTTNRSTSPIAGFQYLADGEVHTILTPGDSISADVDSWAFRACNELTNRAVGFELASVAWAGAGSNTFEQQWTDLETIGVYPDAAFLPVWTPNNGLVELTDAAIDDMREWATSSLRALQAFGITVIPWTGLPTNPSQRDYGATDVKRRDYNDEWRDLAGLGLIVADFGAELAGTIDGDGQELMLAGSEDDDIHPNSTGKDLLKPLAKNALAAAGVYRLGSLVAA